VSSALGIDIGTTNVKAVLIADDGSLASSASRELTTITGGGSVEQDAEVTWQAVIDAIIELSNSQPQIYGQVRAMGVCSQYSSIVGIDADAKPVTPMVMWADQRGTDLSWEIMSRHEDAFTIWVDRHGIPPVGGGISLAHILHLEHSHKNSRAVDYYVESMDFITARLTGRVTATTNSAFMTQLCDNRSDPAPDYDPDLVAMAGLDPSRLPPLVPIDSIVGELSADLAKTLGLPPGVLVATGTNDTAAVAIASGATAPGVAGLAVGTTTVLVDTLDSFAVDLDHEIVSMPGPFGDTRLVMAENGLGGKVLDHVMTQLIHVSDSIGDSRATNPFGSVELALSKSPPGADGVMFLPWLAGSMAPNSSHETRGGFVNMSLDTSRIDLVRAAVEGIAHNLGWLLPHVENLTGRAIEVIHFTGGGARIDGFDQVMADVVGRPVAVVDTPHLATARSAALLARHRTGELTRDELGDLVETCPARDPSPEHRSLYDHRQSQFEACFEALLPIHTAFRGAS